MRHLKTVIIVIIAMFCIETGSAEAANKIRFYNIVSPPMAGGAFSKMMKDIGKTIEPKLKGYEFEYIEGIQRPGDNAVEMAYKYFKEGKADIVTIVNPLEYVIGIDKWNGIFKPAFTLLMGKKDSQEYCFYVREDSGITNVKQLKGKVWGGSDTIPSQVMLHEQGVDEPMTSYFKEMKFIMDAPPSKLTEALSKKEVEVIGANKHFINLGGTTMTDSSSKTQQTVKLKTFACTPGEHGWIFAFRKDVDPEVMKQITKILLNADKDPAFRNFQFLFAAIQGKFAPLDESKDLERTKEIAAMMKKYNWQKVRMEQYKKYKQPK